MDAQVMTDQPRPWACSRDGSRLQWRWNALVCPVCGPVAGLPPRPGTSTDAADFLTD